MTKTHFVHDVIELKRAVIESANTYSKVVEKHLVEEKRLSWVTEGEKTQKPNSRKKALKHDQIQAQLDFRAALKDVDLNGTKPTKEKKHGKQNKKKRPKTHFRKSQKPSRL